MSGVEFGLLLIGLFIMAILYSSVGHGGASGYLAIMSLTSYGLMESAWLKQHAWFLNIIVASLAFYYYRKEGYHDIKLTIPFVIASIPMAFLGGFLLIDGSVYDLLLSITLVLAAWRLYGSMAFDEEEKTTIPTFQQAAPWGCRNWFSKWNSWGWRWNFPFTNCSFEKMGNTKNGCRYICNFYLG
uniref:Probable membrane transporter protein n=1 Tax=uncultured marine group II/III euryarchaeote AD1000_114_C07 TaxID=1457719 RepID=A0A075FNJ0_9EURY|nr:hypothetical protein [uncultured marine group II/III euryarchaeote AD1000_114_C07]